MKPSNAKPEAQHCAHVAAYYERAAYIWINSLNRMNYLFGNPHWFVKYHEWALEEAKNAALYAKLAGGAAE